MDNSRLNARKKNVTSRSGFTLIELLLYIAITSVILVFISTFVSLLLQARIKNQTISEVENQGLQIARVITLAVRNAEDINLPVANTVGSVLSLNVVGSALSPTVFSLSNGSLSMTEGGNGTDLLSNNRVKISNLNFTNMSRPNTPGMISFQFNLSYVTTTLRNEYDFSKTFYASASLR